MPNVALTGIGGNISESEPGKPPTVVGSGPDWIKVKSSHYYVHSKPGDANMEERWLARVENVGEKVVCGVTIRPSFRDGQGQELWSILGASVYGPPYVTPQLGVIEQCIEPGGFAFAIGSQLGRVAHDVSMVAEVVYSVSGFTYADAQPAEAVSVSNLELDGDVVRGTLTNGDRELSFWRVYIFGENDAGFPIISQDFSGEKNGISPNAVWNFESQALGPSVTKFDVFWTYNLRP
jgi:hypothetical protein